MSDYTRRTEIFTKFAVVIALLCILWPFWAGGFSENYFNSMLNLGLYLLRIVGTYNIYTEFVLW